MRRRALLATLGTTLVTGCSARQIDGPDRSPGGQTETTTGADAVEESPFGHDASVVQATPTAERPPTVRITVRNEADAEHTLTTANYTFPFTDRTGEGDDQTSMLLTADVPSTRRGECWRSLPRHQPMINGKAFAPGESVSRKYAVQNPKSERVCWPPGEYAFVQTYYLNARDPGSIEGATQYTWTVTLTVTDAPAVRVEG